MNEALELLDRLETILKDPERAETFEKKRANTSLALLAVDGIRAYLEGEHVQAAEDLAAAAEEILERQSRRGS